MTIEEVYQIFENTDGKWEGDNAMQGLLIISKYFDISKEDIITYGAHDVIGSVGIEDALKKGITKEDLEKLAKLNWCADEEGECFLCFV